MNQSQGILVGVIVILIVAGGAYLYYNPPGQAGTTNTYPTGTMNDGAANASNPTSGGTTTTGSGQTASATVQLNGVAALLGTDILPIKVTEDSRCPVDVQCIQAGTVRVQATSAKTGEAAPITFTLGQPQTIGNTVITLTAVTPDKNSKTVIASSDYRFTFTATSK